MTKFLSRKFILALLFTLTGCLAFLITGKLTGAEFVSFALGIVGFFSAADVALNHIHKDKSDPDNP